MQSVLVSKGRTRLNRPEDNKGAQGKSWVERCVGQKLRSFLEQGESSQQIPGAQVKWQQRNKVLQWGQKYKHHIRWKQCRSCLLALKYLHRSKFSILGPALRDTKYVKWGIRNGNSNWKMLDYTANLRLLLTLTHLQGFCHYWINLQSG